MEKLIIRNTCSVKCTIEMNVVATSASIAIVISFINKIMRICSPTTKQLYPELSVRIPSRLKRGEDAEEDGSEGN